MSTAAGEVLRQSGRRLQPRGPAPPPSAAPQADRDRRYLRGREVISHGTGWVERIVVDAADISTYFTPLAITLNIDSFEHLDFETRPDQLLVYTLVQGDERVVVEFAPIGAAGRPPFVPRSSSSTPVTSCRWSCSAWSPARKSDVARALIPPSDAARPRQMPRSPRTYGRPSAAGAPSRLRAAEAEPEQRPRR